MPDPDTLFRVAALNAAYASCIDSDRLEEWPSFFQEKCLYKITTADNHKRGYAAGIIYADSRAMLIDRVAALRQANIYEAFTSIGSPRKVGPCGYQNELWSATASALTPCWQSRCSHRSPWLAFTAHCGARSV
jgi:hypothetical protein